MKKVGLASDHAGFELKEFVKTWLTEKGYPCKDFGTYSTESCDYADYAHPLALAIEAGECGPGVAICGSGEGISMTLNKHQGIRAALCWIPEIAHLSRQHNDANVLVMPGRFIDHEMAEKIFMKGCEAVAETAVRAGCRFFAGYPITPQNDVPEYFARRMPQVNGVFIQGESEVASANMAYGAAAAGVRSMTSSSSCGISLKSEAISWMAGANLPVVIANFQRGGPGIGTIQPAQQDYNQATKASGNGGFRMLVLSPSTLQEAVDMTWEAFELADKYSKPVLLLMDGFTGTMMEPVILPDPLSEEEVAAIRATKTWTARGKHGGPQHKVMCGPGLDTRISQAQMNQRDAELYESWKTTEVEYEDYLTEDAEIILTAYGISGRIAKSAVNILRGEGVKAGLIRPKKVYPFPAQAYEKLPLERLRGIVCAEMSIPAQFAEDVGNVVHGRTKIVTALSSGGDILDRSTILDAARGLMK